MELETYKQTRQGLDEMYNVVWKQYKEEKRIRQVGCWNDVIILLLQCSDEHVGCVYLRGAR